MLLSLAWEEVAKPLGQVHRERTRDNRRVCWLMSECLTEIIRHQGAWRVAVRRVAQSRTQLK